MGANSRRDSIYPQCDKILLDVDFNQCYKGVHSPISTLLLSFVGRNMMNVIKCPSTSSPQEDINNNPYPNLKNNPNTNTNLKVTNRQFMLRLNATLRVVIQIGYTSYFVHAWTKEALLLKITFIFFLWIWVKNLAV